MGASFLYEPVFVEEEEEMGVSFLYEPVFVEEA